MVILFCIYSRCNNPASVVADITKKQQRYIVVVETVAPTSRMVEAKLNGKC
jgi:hypothetical protein